MGLFFDILSTINHPEQRGSVERLFAVISQSQQMEAQYNLDAPTLQALVSGLGRAMQSSLQDPDPTNPLDSSTSPKPEQQFDRLSQWVQSVEHPRSKPAQPLWSPDRQRIVIRDIAQRTGLPIPLVESMLPGLISLVLGLLNMGTIQTIAKVTNPLLIRFRDDSSNLGDVLRMGERFLGAA